MAEIIVDTKEIDRLAKDIVAAKSAMIGRLAERGFQLLRREVPIETGNLKQGVGVPEVDMANLEATLTVSARSGERGGGVAEVFGKDGKPTGKRVSLRPSPAFNYAEAVARGRAAISPKSGRALLIPLATAPSGEGYLLVGGKVFIVRRSARAVAANPYDKRAAERLQTEAPGIGEAVLKRFV